MINICKYLALVLLLSSTQVCQASDQWDLEAQRPSVVVFQEKTISPTADAFLKHGVGDIAFLATTALRQVSDSEVITGLFILVQLGRYYELLMTNVHATSDAMRHQSWPYVFFAVGMVIHAVGDLAFDLPSLADYIRQSDTFLIALEGIPLIKEAIGANNVINYAAGAADAVKVLAVPIAALTFTLALYRFKHDGTRDVLQNKLRSSLQGQEEPRRGRSRTRVKTL